MAINPRHGRSMPRCRRRGRADEVVGGQGWMLQPRRFLVMPRLRADAVLQEHTALVALSPWGAVFAFPSHVGRKIRSDPSAAARGSKAAAGGGGQGGGGELGTAAGAGGVGEVPPGLTHTLGTGRCPRSPGSSCKGCSRSSFRSTLSKPPVLGTPLPPLHNTSGPGGGERACWRGRIRLGSMG